MPHRAKNKINKGRCLLQRCLLSHGLEFAIHLAQRTGKTEQAQNGVIAK